MAEKVKRAQTTAAASDPSFFNRRVSLAIHELDAWADRSRRR